MIFILEWDSSWAEDPHIIKMFLPPQTYVPKAKVLTCLAILVAPVYYIKLVLFNQRFML